MANRQDFASIDRALKAAPREKRIVRFNPGILKPLLFPATLALGAVLTFVVPEPAWERAYAKADVLAQTKDRRLRREPIDLTPYRLIDSDPFPGQTHGPAYDYVLTIGDDHYRATAAAKGEYTLRDGAIVLHIGAKTKFINLRSTGRAPISNIPGANLLPGPLKAIANAPLAEGRTLNITSAATSHIVGHPIFYIPESDRVLFEKGSVERIERIAGEFVVTFSDGWSGFDWIALGVLVVGGLGTVRQFT